MKRLKLAELIHIVESHSVDDYLVEVGKHGWGKVAKKLVQGLLYFIRCAQVWKQAAKKWRKRALYARDDLTVAKSLVDFEETIRHEAEAEATATRRLELLADIEDFVQVCPVCLIRIKDHPFDIFKKAVGHADDCELAREVANVS